MTEYFGGPFIQPQTPRTGVVTLRSGRLNLRGLPSTDAPVITQIPNGAEIQILGEYDGWYSAEYGGLYGFVSSAFVRLR